MIGVALFLYSIVLRAYPPSLRGQYGSLMIEEARAMLLEGKSAGFTAFLQVTFRLIVDAGVSLPREWRRSFQSGLPRVGRRTGGIADLRYALRSYRRTPGVTVLAVGTFPLRSRVERRLKINSSGPGPKGTHSHCRSQLDRERVDDACAYTRRVMSAMSSSA